jgi:membrane-associated phospholipid phosphatase
MVISRRLSGQPAARQWIRGGLYALAGYIAWSRVLQDGHWFTDIVTGSIAGIYVGRSFYAFNHHDGVDHWLAWDPRPSTRVTVLPPIVTPDGFSVAARIRL